MNRIGNKKLVVVAAAIFALALGWTGSGKEPPIYEVTFEADFIKDPYVPGPWYGVITICIEGQEYEGTAVWQSTGKGCGTKKGTHGFGNCTYDFPGLGSFDVWERYETCIILDEPDHLKREYTGIERIIGGTDAFANAEGVFHFEGTTEAWITPDKMWAQVKYTGRGMIYGIELPE
jgi:hypothetical protein